MSLDTTAANRLMDAFDGRSQVWLFGYGSLIFKADFPFIARRPAHIAGWTRRFWQGSHDHRGTEASPGRVATIIKAPGETCFGMAYLISPEVFAHLDHREKNGYLRHALTIVFDDGGSCEGLVYVAPQDNAAYLGQASEDAIARQIAGAVGPSGPNRDYLNDLAAALRALGQLDPHVAAIERHLARLD
jgi:cation transport regulator ChaC